jgi:hypothetical protein
MNNLNKIGFLIVKNQTIVSQVEKANKIFKNQFKKKFSNNPVINREIVKRFADHPFISSIYTSKTMMKILKDIGLKIPVKCGPLVTHYTSNNKTGNSYGLPYHQDYPSMASSKCSVILWLNLVDSNKETHGIEMLPKQHLNGLLEGKQTKIGYILKKKYYKLKSIIPSIKAGDLLIMSSFLPHKTFVNQNFKGWKVSLSQRYDDLADKDWRVRSYKNAYKVTVDRDLYLKNI